MQTKGKAEISIHCEADGGIHTSHLTNCKHFLKHMGIERGALDLSVCKEKQGVQRRGCW